MTWIFCLSRYDGPEEDDGEVGGTQDSSGDEEDDLGGDWRLQRHDQLPGLCEDDVGQALGCAQTVRTLFFCSFVGMGGGFVLEKVASVYLCRRLLLGRDI